jgi:hypothetical protein
LKTYVAELHVHTVLSPCADVEMIPPLIVRRAIDARVDLIAITDHNASANVSAVREAASGTGLTVLPGMELQTREEVHLLCIFDGMGQIEAWQQLVDEWMPPMENDIDLFGEQFVVDSSGEFVRREGQLLLVSANVSLREAVEQVLYLGGLAIPAHVDRKSFSLLANLGLVPPDIPIEALEISRRMSPAEARQKFPQLEDFPLIQNGDAHCLDDLLAVNVFTLAAPTVAELKLALRSVEGRSLHVRSAVN